ncbi:N-terminal cleavage protein [Opitutaceae bacterium TAV5]|nr:N-terminal cleavage protein [Opitutaceae bacterium TAV5]
MITHSQRVFVCQRRSEAESPARASREARRVVRHTSAFTLIELLCVIAIIGVLAAIVIAVVGSVRQRAYAARTSSNLRQLQLANIMYAGEHKERYVPCSYIPAGGGGRITWRMNNEFRAYLGITAPFDSSLPDNSLAKYPAVTRTGFPQWMAAATASIGSNYNSNENSDSKRVVRISDIPRRSRTICFADSCDWQVAYTGRDSSSAPDWVYKSGALAYRSPGERCLVVAYEGNVFSITKTEAANRQLWYYNE